MTHTFIMFIRALCIANVLAYSYMLTDVSDRVRTSPIGFAAFFVLFICVMGLIASFFVKPQQ